MQHMLTPFIRKRVALLRHLWVLASHSGSAQRLGSAAARRKKRNLKIKGRKGESSSACGAATAICCQRCVIVYNLPRTCGATQANCAGSDLLLGKIPAFHTAEARVLLFAFFLFFFYPITFYSRFLRRIFVSFF